MLWLITDKWADIKILDFVFKLYSFRVLQVNLELIYLDAPIYL